MALFVKLPNWASILITVIAAVIVVGLVSWGTYTLVKPGPSKLPEGEEPECKNLWWYDNEHSTCQEPKQFCGAYMYYGLKTFETKNECEKDLAGEDQFKDWKTYKNEEYGFEVKYPNAWKIDQTRSTANEVVFDIGISESREAVKFEKNTNNLTLERVKSERFKDRSIIISESQLTVDGEKAYKIETSEFGQTFIIFLHNAFIYTITTGDRFISEKILSTFKFLD